MEDTQHHLVTEKRVDINMRASKKPPIYLTVHHNQEAVKLGDRGPQMRQHQESMFYYNIEVDGKRVDRETVVDGKPLIVRKSLHYDIFLGDTPYHFFIDSTGLIVEGRKLDVSAYSNTTYKNDITAHITVVLEGDFRTNRKDGKPEVKPTKKQIDSLVRLLLYLAEENDIPLAKIGYHSQVADTECPGQHLVNEFPRIKDRLQALGIK